MRVIESSFRKLYQEYLESGLSIRDFCTNHDFAVSTFYYWQKKLSDNVPHEGFIPLLIERQPMVNASSHLEVASERDEFMTQDNDLEFTFPNGTKLHLKGHIDLALLKTIVHIY